MAELVIEDGTIVDGADSLVTVAELRAHVDAYGGVIPAADPDCESLLRRAGIELWNRPWAGELVDAGQPLPWPRTGVTVAGTELADSAIPADVKRGQMALAVEMLADEAAGRSASDQLVLGKSIAGAISYTYSEGQRASVSSGRRSGVLFARYLRGRSGPRMVRG